MLGSFSCKMNDINFSDNMEIFSINFKIINTGFIFDAPDWFYEILDPPDWSDKINISGRIKIRSSNAPYEMIKNNLEDDFITNGSLHFEKFEEREIIINLCDINILDKFKNLILNKIIDFNSFIDIGFELNDDKFENEEYVRTGGFVRIKWSGISLHCK